MPFLHILLGLNTADPVLLKIVLLTGGILLAGFILKALNQPYIIAYIVAGILLGPHGMNLIPEEQVISGLGSFGLILLLFFIGMEISLPSLIANWKISVLGTLVQVLISILVTYIIGYYFEWSLKRVIILGFVISLSSTAVVIKLLQDRNEINSQVGQNVVGILLAQDVIIVPMIIVLNYLGGEKTPPELLLRQIVGAILIIGIIYLVLKKGKLSLPFQGMIRRDHEIQVFLAIVICFGISLATAWLGLSSALGAFVAGILVSSFRATQWVHDSLHAFRIVFVALFFSSIGMLIDLDFLQEHFVLILIFVLSVLVINNLINASIFMLFKQNWKDSFYAGAVLSQIGEFSFILGSIGFTYGIVTDFTYSLIISIISVTLFVSPLWISLIRALMHPDIKSRITTLFK